MIHLKRLYANNFKQLQELDFHFPDHARVLVQGKNEAGKSTLFEAVFFALFGTALATESGARGLDDLIGYGMEKARVELDVQAGDRVFQIARTVVRGKSNVWELDIAQGDTREEVRGNTAVNKRLIAELGFDGDALLNTCFVEQKKLEKLEGLNKAKREESLAKLLNLDALVEIESDLKIRAEDKQELDRLKKRAELADLQTELPTHAEQLQKVESQLKLIDLRGAVEGAAEETRAVQQLDAAIRSLAAQRDAAAQRVERIEALKEAMQNVKEARDAAEHAAENARDAERLKADQTDARRAAEDAPRLQARTFALRHLAHLLQHLDQLRSARDASAQRAAQLKDVETRLNELNATLAREEQALAQVEARLREVEIGDALGDWIAARREVAPAAEVENTVAEKQAGRDQISRRFRIQVYGLAALLFVLVVGAALLQPLAIGLLILAALALLVLAARATVLWRDLARAAEALGQAQGEARAKAFATDAQVARLKDVEARLTSLGVAIPETTDLAHLRRVAIAREIDAARKTVDELRADQDATRERRLNARAVLGELQNQNEIADAANAPGERARCERAAHKADTILARWQPRLTATAQSLGAELDASAIQRTRFQIDAQIEQAQRRANDAARLGQEIARREQQMKTLWARAKEAFEQARRVKPGAPEWTPALAAEGYNGFGKDLRAEYDALGGEAVVKQAREIEGELGRRQGERATRARNAALLVSRAQDLLGNASALSANPDVRELEDLHARLQSLDLGDEATLRAQHRDLVGRVHSLRDRQTQLEGELGLEGQPLDRAVCRAEWAEKARQSRVRERGVEIVSLARRRIVQKVLPSTMDYMCRILPALTRDRYHDAQLDPDSYKIQVWDERAPDGGAFKEKNIFSGGTKDQFSLALRLAFALATLPQERGSAPSFIFLDEPLGSFDDERADALIYLLTEGEIAQAFNQIFLISHVRVDERLFTHRVVLENGRVAYSDLPGGMNSHP
ncbi:MAG: SMC family ATPase [Chloroflexota bacterium]|nr:SMC family ATPase [Chloroflexota bacterium]